MMNSYPLKLQFIKDAIGVHSLETSLGLSGLKMFNLQVEAKIDKRTESQHKIRRSAFIENDIIV